MRTACDIKHKAYFAGDLLECYIIVTIQKRFAISLHCNKKVMKSYRHPGVLGTKADVLAMNVDRLLNGSEDFGIGKVRLLNNDVYKPNNNYYGRCITYEVMAFNRKMGGAK